MLIEYKGFMQNPKKTMSALEKARARVKAKKENSGN